MPVRPGSSGFFRTVTAIVAAAAGLIGATPVSAAEPSLSLVYPFAGYLAGGLPPQMGFSDKRDAFTGFTGSYDGGYQKGFDIRPGNRNVFRPMYTADYCVYDTADTSSHVYLGLCAPSTDNRFLWNVIRDSNGYLNFINVGTGRCLAGTIDEGRYLPVTFACGDLTHFKWTYDGPLQQ